MGTSGMPVGAVQGWDQSSRRRVPRYRVQAPLDVTVLRSGIPDTLPGRSVNLCERGISAMLAGELALGEAVGVELRLPWTPDPLRARAMVRHHNRLSCGLEFVGLTPEQRASIIAWAERSKAELDPGVRDSGGTSSGVNKKPPAKVMAAPVTVPAPEAASAPDIAPPPAVETASGIPAEPASENQFPTPRRRGRLIFASIATLIVAAILVAGFWWRWNRSWQELESGLHLQDAASADQPAAHVTAEEMQRLLVHKVDPTYPESARAANLQGVIVLDVVVGRDGSVRDVHPLNGPTVLAQSAVEAMRWWKFQPYRLNGKPVVVQTTVAMEFKP